MNEPLDLLGRLGGALRQGAHFRRHHRKSAAGVAGAGRLDPGVEGEKVGLEGDLIDDADDLPDLARRLLDLAHRFDRLPHDLAALLRLAPGVAGDVLRVPRSLRGLADRGRDLIERRRCLFEARGLLFGAMGEIVRRGCDLLGARTDALGGVADVSERGGELRDYGIEIVLKLAERFRQLVGDLTIEVFLGQLRQSRSQSLDGEPLALGRAFAIRGELVGALRRLLIEECEIHVDQRGLDERAERRPELVCLRLPASKQALRPDFPDNR